MLRMKPVADARKAESYYAKSDGGYYLGGDKLSAVARDTLGGTSRREKDDELTGSRVMHSK